MLRPVSIHNAAAAGMPAGCVPAANQLAKDTANTLIKRAATHALGGQSPHLDSPAVTSSHARPGIKQASTLKLT